MTSWQVGLLVNGVIGIAYLGIAATVLRGVDRRRLWRTDRLAVATGAIFATCAAGHIAHLDHLVLGAEVAEARVAYDVHLAVIDGITAAVAVVYWSLRRQFGGLLARGQVYTDGGQRLHEAALIHDRVLQQLVAARLALELDRHDDAGTAVERGLRAVHDLMLDLDPQGLIAVVEDPREPQDHLRASAPAGSEPPASHVPRSPHGTNPPPHPRRP